jgi:dienelactone hydrolase
LIADSQAVKTTEKGALVATMAASGSKGVNVTSMMMASPDSQSIPVPRNIAEWIAQRIEVRAALWTLLGDLPPLFTPQPKVTAVEHRDRYMFEHFEFDNGTNSTVYGYLMIPDAIRSPAPAILYQHAHGGKYSRGKEELFQDDPIGITRGAALVQAGYIVIAVDTYAFGQREHVGPAHELQTGSETEQAWFKKFLWEGKSLWGMIVRDDLLTLNYLLTRPEVDPTRIGTTGMSMGGSRATWLAALDERIAAVIPVAQMTRYHDFAKQGSYNLHSLYYYVPGALQSGLDMEVLVSLAAPRRQAILIGDSDPLSPIEGVSKIGTFTRHIYELYHAADQFELIVYQGVGHTYTAEMFQAMLEGFRAALL